MNSGAPDWFGVPLTPDPAISLKPLGIAPSAKTGPLHKVQFVIEFVGPRSILTSSAAQLMNPEWFQALGQPSIWVMRPADLHWQQFTPMMDGSIDSLALPSDMLTVAGALSSASALQLLQYAERFGPIVSRRPMPVPHPGEVSARVRDLQEIQSALDIGFSMAVVGTFSEKDLWIACARLGLEFSPGGTFDWREPGHPFPLLSVSPIGKVDAFSLSQVQSGEVHEGVTVGFSIPRCISPMQALEGCFHTADYLAKALQGVALSDGGEAAGAPFRDEARTNLRSASQAFAQAGITPGSPESLKLFG